MRDFSAYESERARARALSGKTLGISMSPQLRAIFEALGQPTE